MIVFISAGRHPVVGGAGVGLLDGADEGAVLDPGHVGGVGGAVERVGLLLRVEPGEGAGLDELVGEGRPLLVRAGAPVHAVGLGQLGDFLDPGQQAGMRRRRIGLVGVVRRLRSAPPVQSRFVLRAVGGRGRHAGGSLLTHRGGVTTGRRTLRRNDVDMGVSRSGRWDVPATVRRIGRGARPERCEAPHKGRTLSGRTTFLRADQALLCCPIPTDGTSRLAVDANACVSLRRSRRGARRPKLARIPRSDPDESRRAGRCRFHLSAMPSG